MGTNDVLKVLKIARAVLKPKKRYFHQSYSEKIPRIITCMPTTKRDLGPDYMGNFRPGSDTQKGPCNRNEISARAEKGT